LLDTSLKDVLCPIELAIAVESGAKLPQEVGLLRQPLDGFLQGGDCFLPPPLLPQGGPKAEVHPGVLLRAEVLRFPQPVLLHTEDALVVSLDSRIELVQYP